MKMIKRALSIVLVFSILFGICPVYAVNTADISKEYSDVNSTDWYYDAVQYMTDKGLMNGVSNDSFSPQSNTSRAMIVTILWRMEGSPAPNTDNSFSDVVSGSYYEDAVVWASEEEIVNGYGDGIFGPDDLITREQLAAILYRYMGSPTQTDSVLNDYSDSDKISPYATEAMIWAVSQGIINGVDDNVLDPQGFASRAQVATMMMRLDNAIEDSNTDDDKENNQHGSSGGSSSGGGGGSSSGDTDQDDNNNPLEGIKGSNPEEYSIIAAEKDGKTFTITYSNSAACNLVVTLYTDDGKTEYMSMRTSLAASEADADGNIKMSTAIINAIESIPDTFLLVAVLENNNGIALSNSFTSRQYTEAYQEYEKQTAESLEAAGEEVIDYGDAGYAVASDGVEVIEQTATDNADGSYTLPAGNNVAAGDKIMIPIDRTPDVQDDEPISVPVKVQSIIENTDGTVTVIPDEDATISDFYDVLNVDVILSGDETGGSGDLPVARAARSSEPETSITPLKISESLTIQDHLKIDLEGSLKLKVKLVYDKKHLGEDYLETELTQTITTGITGTVTGKVGTSTLTDPAKIVDVDMPIGTTPLMADVEVTFPVKADITAEGSFKAKLEVSSGYRYTTVDGAQRIANTDNSNLESTIKGKFEIGAGPELSVGVTLPGDLFSANVSGEAMLSLHGDTDKSASVLPDTKHACDLCVDGAIDLGAKIKGSLDYKLFDWAEGTLIEITLFDTTIDICTFYYSAVNDEDSIFKGEPHFEVNKDCPNKSFPITVLAKRSDGQNVTVQIDITYGNDQKPKATISSGETIWLCNGTNYHFKTEIDGAPVVKSLVIAGKEIVTLYGAGVNLSGIVTEADTGSPIANAEVTLTKTDDTKTISGSTGSDGRYLLEGIPVGEYTLTVKKDAYQTYEQAISLTQNSTHDVKLEPSGNRVFGTVSDADGPLSGVLVTITNGETTKQCTTDTDGTYESDPLTPGEYTIKFSKFGYDSVEQSIRISDTDVSCNITMEKGTANLTATVVNKDSNPISEAAVSLYLNEDSAEAVATGTTDSNGVVSWDDLNAGNFIIKVAKDGYAPYSGEVLVEANQDNTKMIALQPGGSCGPNLYWTTEGAKLIIYGEGPMYNYGQSVASELDKTGNAPWRSTSGITEVEIQEGATTIGDDAFRNMQKLEKATLCEGITHIGNNAFRWSTVGNIQFPSTLESLGTYAFYDLSEMDALDLSQTKLEVIPEYCFAYPTSGGGSGSIESINLPRTLREIGNHAFEHCEGWSDYYVEIPEGVTKIGDYAFACNIFKGYIIPDSVVEVGEYAFYDNENMKEIDLPDSIKILGEGVLSACSSLTTVHLPDNPNITELNSTFSACTSLQKVTIPESVTVLVDTFSSCSKLEEVDIPENLTTVGEEAFMGCDMLRTMVLPNTVTTIAKHAFWMSGIRQYTIPATVTSIGIEAFSGYGEKWFDSITFGGTKTQWDELMKDGADAETHYTLICEGQEYEYPETQEEV